MRSKKYRVAIHNLHEIPNLFNIGIHNYVIDLLRNGDVKILYFDLGSRYISKAWIANFYAYIRSHSVIQSWNIAWNEIEFIFSVYTLNRKCDVLLNFNSHLGASQFPKCLKKFTGIKIYHVNDYFWNRPGSELNKLLISNGVDFVMGYSSHDRYCMYFQKTFPSFKDRVIAVPFGFSKRFINVTNFSLRKNKCVALGSVNPIVLKDYDNINYKEVANFFIYEKWMHKFRRMLVENKDSLQPYFDSMLPVFPQFKDFQYNIVDKFNDYKMFVSCESIYNFPPAKYFEGLACGTVLICADHDCNKDLGLISGFNCIMYQQNNLDDFRDKLNYYANDSTLLSKIQASGTELVINNFTHELVAKKLIRDINIIT